MKKGTLLLLMFALALQGQAQGLKDVFKKDFLMGVSLNPRNVRNAAEQDLIRKEFNSVTCENAMKPGPLHLINISDSAAFVQLFDDCHVTAPPSYV
ncbi:MAG: endo-1,4-beta-xylanase [Bacteroidaceae bacterium]|nr:endo-1,4-beta-xylanase [Bacteroidaceae bacterium]